MSQVAEMVGSSTEGSAPPARFERHRALAAGYWIATALFCLQMGFTAYAQLTLPEVASAFAHLGFPDYFRVMDVRLLAGRAPLPTAAEDGSADGPTREVAISETLARLYWPDRYPIGERLDWPGGKFEIVGIVADVRPTTLESEFIPQAYTAMLDSP